jgi:F-type H+-transporting ATPase subunit delta
MSKISTKNVAEAIYELTRNKTGPELFKTLSEVKDFLVKKRLISKSAEILKKLTDLINQEQGVSEARLTVLKDPSKKVIEKLTEILKKRYHSKVILFETKVDKSIIGGMKIEIGDEIIDLSVKNKIVQLQNHLLTN